jgi:hypothetical protein
MVNTTTAPDTGTSTTSAEAIRIVTFTARSVDDLNRQVTAWVTEHPSQAPLSLSHSAETRYVIPYPASLSGPNRVVVYTAMLLVKTASVEPVRS